MTLYGSSKATSDVMLQAFCWDITIKGERGKLYAHLQSLIGDFAAAGITLLWLPPPSKSRYQHYMGYTPMDFYDVGEFKQWIQEWPVNGQDYWEESKGAETLFGTRAELESLINQAHGHGLKVIADIVINHREAQQRNIQGEKIAWKGDQYQIASTKMAWGYQQADPVEIVAGSGGGGRDDGQSGFAPNIAHTEAVVRTELKEWLSWLQSEIGFGAPRKIRVPRGLTSETHCSNWSGWGPRPRQGQFFEVPFDGWRFDMVKGYAPQHLAEYNYHTKPYLSVGEYWDNNTQLIYDWIDLSDGFQVDQKSMAFDFPLQSHLRNIFWGDKSFDQLGLWKYSNVSIAGGWPAKSVTFLDNHDTKRQAYADFPLDHKRLLQGYAFLLTHPGIPYLYWEHLYAVGSRAHNGIMALSRLRSEQKITNHSHVHVLQAGHDCYAARIDDTTIVKIGDSFWNPSLIPGSWSLKLAGEGWAIWSAA